MKARTEMTIPQAILLLGLVVAAFIAYDYFVNGDNSVAVDDRTSDGSDEKETPNPQPKEVLKDASGCPISFKPDNVNLPSGRSKIPTAISMDKDGNYVRKPVKQPEQHQLVRAVAVEPRWLSNPAVAVAQATTYMALSVLPQDQQQTRFISFYHVPREQLGDYRRLLDGCLQTLSMRKLIKLCTPVPNTFGRLYAIRLNWYSPDTKSWGKAWESLGKTDPYFNDQWLPVREIKLLKEATISNHPIIRGDALLHAFEDDALYAQFLQFTAPKGNKDAEKVMAAVLKVRVQDSLLLGTAEGGAVIWSEVTNENRRLTRHPAASSQSGYWWISSDLDSSAGRQSTLQNLFEDLQDKGREVVASLPNGWQAYGVFAVERDKKDRNKILSIKRIAEVPIKIAHDNNFKDRIVKSPRSCIVCHSKGQGVRRFENIVHKLATTNQIKLLFADENLALRAAEFYGPQVYKAVEKDRASYVDAVFQTTRLTSEEYGELFRAAHTKYFDLPVLAADASRETGLTPEQLKFIVKRSGDPHMALLYNGGMRRNKWEESFQEIMRLRILVTGR